jgi:hypothetical protein
MVGGASGPSAGEALAGFACYPALNAEACKFLAELLGHKEGRLTISARQADRQHRVAK